jgi:hypothetical protein
MKQEIKYILSGMVLPFDRRGCNGRVYTKESVQKAFEDFKLRMNSGAFVGGVLEQSQYDFTNGLNLSDLSHKVVNVEMKDDGIYASLEILNTPKGKLVKQMIDAGVQLWGAQRAWGVDNLGTITLDSIISYDVTGSSAFDYSDMNSLKLIKMPVIKNDDKPVNDMPDEYVIRRLIYDRLEDYKPGDVPIYTNYLKLNSDGQDKSFGSSYAYVDNKDTATHFVTKKAAYEWMNRLGLQTVPLAADPYRHEVVKA